jgi:hypothetical protein
MTRMFHFGASRPITIVCVAMIAFCVVCIPVIAQDGASSSNEPTVPNLPDVNSDILKLVIQDQWDRGNDMFSGRQIKAPAGINVPARDAQRADSVREMLAEAKITTGREYYFAAVILNHSTKSSDLLLAHMLVVTSVAKGNTIAKFMAAATLDRYLWSIKQPQIFGTQFQKGSDQRWTMEPYDRTAISDRVRADWCVVPLAEQENILKTFSERGHSSQTTDCK